MKICALMSAAGFAVAGVAVAQDVGDVRLRLLGVRAQRGQLELLCVNERKRQAATTTSAP